METINLVIGGIMLMVVLWYGFYCVMLQKRIDRIDERLNKLFKPTEKEGEDAESKD